MTIEVGGSTAPEPSGLTELKVSAIWTPTSLTAVPDVDVYLDDTCGTGPSLPSQTDFDYRNRLRVDGAAVSGRCLRVRLHAYNVPTGGVTVYVAIMYHSGSLY